MINVAENPRTVDPERSPRSGYRILVQVTSCMDLRELQARALENPFRSGTEVMLAMTEELGEVATEVALLERIGSKANWQKEPSRERLATEITHLLNCTFALANQFGIDLSETYRPK